MKGRDYVLLGVALAAAVVLGILLPKVEKDHTQVPVQVTEEAIENSTDFYTISATYPRDARDTEGKMREYVEYRVDDAREEWKTGGEVYLAERELSEEFPDRPAPQYELVIGYRAYESQKLKTATYLFSEYRYTGGAHGNTSLASFTFNDAGLVAVEDVLDFEGGKDVELTKLLEQKLIVVLGENSNTEMISQGLGLAFLRPDGTFDREACGCDGFFFPSNFQNMIVTDEGLTFVMSPYQVAPYAAGMPEVSFTWSELAPFINQTFDLPLD